jgi:hypothetical protein
MVLFTALLFTVFGFFLLSIFDRSLRDELLDKARTGIDFILKRTPVISDKVIIDPLTEQIRKFVSGRNVGGLRVDAQNTLKEI